MGYGAVFQYMYTMCTDQIRKMTMPIALTSLCIGALSLLSSICSHKTYEIIVNYCLQPML